MHGLKSRVNSFHIVSLGLAGILIAISGDSDLLSRSRGSASSWANWFGYKGVTG